MRVCGLVVCFVDCFGGGGLGLGEGRWRWIRPELGKKCLCYVMWDDPRICLAADGASVAAIRGGGSSMRCDSIR